MQNVQGRPLSASENQSRARLVDAARHHFSVHGYAATTTRDIATAAAVNPAMIRYYFGHKAGLFETVLRETVAPMLNLINKHPAPNGPVNLAALVQQYHSMMLPYPELPKLIFRALHNPDSVEYDIVMQVFDGVLRFGIDRLLKQISHSTPATDDIDGKAVVVSALALAVFPFLLPPPFRQVLNFSATSDQLAAIASLADRLFIPAKIVQHGEKNA